MLIGQYIGKLTEKNRTALPAKFRVRIGDSAVIAKWYEGCLVVVAKSEWDNLLDRLTTKTSIITSPVRDTDRFILGSAFEVKFDNQGRFILSEILIKYAGLKQELIFLGLGERVEIWDVDTWKKRENYIQEHAAKELEKIASTKDEKQ